MAIETLDDVLNELADKLGVYGCCKNYLDGEGNETGECNEKDPCCCRIGFMIEYENRIKEAVRIEKQLGL